MKKMIATALVSAKARKAATHLLEQRFNQTMALLGLRRRRSLLRSRTGLALGAAVALPLAYMAVKARRH